jgi:hypothetical protein
MEQFSFLGRFLPRPQHLKSCNRITQGRSKNWGKVKSEELCPQSDGRNGRLLLQALQIFFGFFQLRLQAQRGFELCNSLGLSPLLF